MEGFVFFVVVFAVLMLIVIVAALIGAARAKKKVGIFAKHILDNYPELAEVKFLSASQASKAKGLDIALLIDELGKRIILLTDKKETGIASKVYDFESFVSVEPSSRVIERGVWPNKIFSYEKNLTLRFDDGATYFLFLETISNRSGDDKGSISIDNIFAPWIEKLELINPKVN